MTIRKLSVFGVTVAVTLSLALTGCGEEKKPNAKKDKATPSSTLSAVDQQVCTEITEAGSEHYPKLMTTVQQMTQATVNQDQAGFDAGVGQLKTDMKNFSDAIKEAGEPAENPALRTAVSQVTGEMDKFAAPEADISQFDDSTLSGMEDTIKTICG